MGQQDHLPRKSVHACLPSTFTNPLLNQENIPTPPHTHALAPSLSLLLRSTIQRVVLPHLFDPSNPPRDTLADPSSSSQTTAFAQSTAASGSGLASRRPPLLPQGGGPFKGFAHVMLGSDEDVERAVAEWKWEGSKREKEEVGGEEDEGRQEREQARKQGMRAITW